MKNWVNVHYSAQKSEKLYFDGPFLSKAYNILARKFHRNYVSWHWRAKFKGTLTRNLKNDIRYLVNFHASSQKSKNLQFDGFLLSKAYKGLDGKVQKSYNVSWHWRVMQSLKKNWLWVPKTTWRIWWILMWAVASLKVWILMCYFCQKCIMFEPKKYRWVMCHNTEKWWKIWGGTVLCSEKWHEEFVEFWPNTRKFQNLHFNGLLLSKVYNVWAKTLHRSYVMTMKGDAIFKEKLIGGLKNDIRNLVNFHASSHKSENLHFDGLVLSKAYKVLDKKFSRVMSHDTEEWSKENLILEKYAFLCDAIDLKQSVQGTLKV